MYQIKIKPKPPPEHYSWRRPKGLIETDLSSDHDPKAKQEREYWNKQHIFHVISQLDYVNID